MYDFLLHAFLDADSKINFYSPQKRAHVTFTKAQDDISLKRKSLFLGGGGGEEDMNRLFGKIYY